ncbi:MAG: NADH-quinone oxidoreductase subunit C [Acidimicrobiia bacterium]|nr:NADH-quinone oxidoreductase subunit C [Acidimicrobiia bacterium]
MSDVVETEDAVEVDEVREAQLEALGSELGDAIVETFVKPGDDIWVRVSREAWVEAATVLRHELGFGFFNFLSAIDWMPSPYGRDMDSQVDVTLEGAEPKEPEPMEWGYAGGATRFQMLARVNDVTTARGVTLKADLPDDDLSIRTWIPVYAGANWHEREASEMFGIDFVGHPNLRKLYLPGAFEGYPMRKDFALLSRRIKPWPGIVDVEPMPGDDDGDGNGDGNT